MRILILSQFFYPEPNFIANSLAQGLRGQGHDVEVLTGFPNYPGGKIYPGYRVRFIQREEFDGIPITRVPLYPSHDGSGVKRAINYMSFALAAASIGSVRVAKPDVVYVYHPPATVGLPACVLRVLRGVPFVYHIQDLWPDTLRATGMVDSDLLLGVVSKWCAWLYRRASSLIVISPGFKKRLEERGVPAHKVHVVYNWKDESIQPSTEVDENIVRVFDPQNRFNIVFAGNMGQAQALQSVIDAATILEGSHPKIQFIFIGSGVAVKNLRRYAQARELRNVVFLPYQPADKIEAILQLADVLLVHLRDDPLFSITVPSKTQAYLAAGKPILMAVRGDAADLVTQAGAGMVCEPEDPQSIAEAAIQLYRLPPTKLRDMGAKGKRFYNERLSMRRGIETIASILREAKRSSAF